jgi:hypothetical protein
MGLRVYEQGEERHVKNDRLQKCQRT